MQTNYNLTFLHFNKTLQKSIYVSGDMIFSNKLLSGNTLRQMYKLHALKEFTALFIEC